MAAALALIGGVEMLLFQGAGARIPNEVWDNDSWREVPLLEPLRDAVWPALDRRGAVLARSDTSTDSQQNLVAMAAPEWVAPAIPPLAVPPDAARWSWPKAWRSRSSWRRARETPGPRRLRPSIRFDRSGLPPTNRPRE